VEGTKLFGQPTDGYREGSGWTWHLVK